MGKAAGGWGQVSKILRKFGDETSNLTSINTSKCSRFLFVPILMTRHHVFLSGENRVPLFAPQNPWS